MDRKPRLIRDRDIRLRFAYFFGSLFKLTSLYLESNLDGTFEECVREALVSGDVESLFVMCKAASKPVEVFEMCMVVTHAGEQLWNYLDTMEDWLATDPTPEQRARLERSNNEATAGARDGQDQYTDASPPEWLMPERYRVHQDTKLRLQVHTVSTHLFYCIELNTHERVSVVNEESVSNGLAMVFMTTITFFACSL